MNEIGYFLLAIGWLCAVASALIIVAFLLLAILYRFRWLPAWMLDELDEEWRR